jgi:poly-gamma-glutamate synthase PgsB/CapB
VIGNRLLIILAVLLVLLFSSLLFERLIIDRRLGRIKLRIAVTGTRGKSSVTRLIAAALRESGLRVVAKTTGSAAMVILPDGSEKEIPRVGPPSILENKSILRLAVRHKADALVSEMMSITPECLRVEVRKLLKPGLLVITNVRLDHREEQGYARPETARSLSVALGPDCAVLIPKEDILPELEQTAAKVGAKISRLSGGDDLKMPEDVSALIPMEFEENIHLALAAADFCGIERAVAWRGMAGARPDLGGLRVFRAAIGSPPSPWLLVSAFAANDPESSRLALAKLRGLTHSFPGKRRAVLNLRDDRGDRTLQWLAALKDGFFNEFNRVVLVGSPAVAALRRRARRIGKKARMPANHISVMGERSPEKITAAMAVESGSALGGVIIGLGNMGGLGRGLVEYWEQIGEPMEHDLA